MFFDSEIPYTTSGGIDYLIKFTAFDPDRLPEGINVTLIDIVIETDAPSGAIDNNAHSLLQITKIILEYMRDKDAILYSYCSDRPIKKSKRNLHQSHQEFRSNLFSAMFSLNNAPDFINKVIVINDPDSSHHYLHLIGNIKFQRDIDFIANKLQEFDK